MSEERYRGMSAASTMIITLFIIAIMLAFVDRGLRSEIRDLQRRIAILEQGAQR